VLDRFLLWAEAVECVLRRVGVDVLGSATSGADALALIKRYKPRLLVTDVAAADGCTAGLECLLAARRLDPGLIVIVLSLSDESEQIDAALRAGASAYVLKSAHPDDLAFAVRQSFSHSMYLAPPEGPANGRPRLQGVAADRAQLTKRERQILELAAEGFRTRAWPRCSG
jgi:DNA-binding NarL/FixJ family response regulator